MQQISITVPCEPDELRAAAALLEQIADLEPETETPVAPPPPPDTPTGEVDALGVPWDARIHSSGHAKLAKSGRWKRIRGIDKAFADKIEQELSARTPAPRSTDPTGEITNFPQLMALIASLGLSTETVAAIVQSCGVESLPVLGSRPDCIPAVATALRHYRP